MISELKKNEIKSQCEFQIQKKILNLKQVSDESSLISKRNEYNQTMDFLRKLENSHQTYNYLQPDAAILNNNDQQIKERVDKEVLILEGFQKIREMSLKYIQIQQGLSNKTNRCLVCDVNQINIINIPCGHAYICNECNQQQSQSKDICIACNDFTYKYGLLLNEQ